MKCISPLILMALFAVSLTASLEPSFYEDDFDNNYISREFEPIMHIYEEEKSVEEKTDDDEFNVKMVNEEPTELIEKAANLTKPGNGSDFEKIVDDSQLKKFKEGFVKIANNVSSTSGKYKDCQQLYDAGRRHNSVFELHPDRSPVSVNASCDFTTDPGHGWTNIMRRINGDVFFYHNWAAYTRGFGALGADHWLGLDNIKYLANQQQSILRVDLYDCDGQHRFAEYDFFALGNADTDYELLLGTYSAGDAGDSLSFHRYNKFSTYDRDNDAFSGNCASMYKAGWWYNDCYETNLNGLAFECSPVPPGHTGITWKTFRGFSYSLPRVEMKIRPR